VQRLAVDQNGDVATPAVAALVKAGVAHRTHTYEHDPAAASYGQEAAEALGLDPPRVFKTLVASVGSAIVVAVVPVSGQLDLKALAASMGAKRAEMADSAVAERATGYVVGGISPIGHKRKLPVVIDASASEWDTIFVSGGRRGLELEISPDDLVAATGGRFASIARSR
jgi:Cys-tRNA(Pro)/Cys-tRNA(Cys) deacylase